MRLDAQVGFVDRARFSYRWMADAAPHMHRDFTSADLWRILGRNKYEGVIAVAMLDDGAETDWLLESARQNRWMAGVIGPRVEDRWVRDPLFAGVRSPVGAVSMMQEAAAAGVVVDLVVRSDEVERAIEMLEAVPSARVAVVADASPGWDPSPWETLARRSSVMVKVCGLINDAGSSGWKAETYRPFVRKILEWCGAERVMYGSDWPRCMHTGTWKESLAAFTQAMGARTMEERSLILGENAQRFYARRSVM